MQIIPSNKGWSRLSIYQKLTINVTIFSETYCPQVQWKNAWMYYQQLSILDQSRQGVDNLMRTPAVLTPRSYNRFSEIQPFYLDNGLNLIPNKQAYSRKWKYQHFILPWLPSLESKTLVLALQIGSLFMSLN